MERYVEEIDMKVKRKQQKCSDLKKSLMEYDKAMRTAMSEHIEFLFDDSPVVQINKHGMPVAVWVNADEAAAALELRKYDIIRCCKGEDGSGWMYAGAEMRQLLRDMRRSVIKAEIDRLTKELTALDKDRAMSAERQP